MFVGHPSSFSSPLLRPLQYHAELHGDFPSIPTQHSVPYTMCSVLGYVGGKMSLIRRERLCVCRSSGCSLYRPFRAFVSGIRSRTRISDNLLAHLTPPPFERLDSPI